MREEMNMYEKHRLGIDSERDERKQAEINGECYERLEKSETVIMVMETNVERRRGRLNKRCLDELRVICRLLVCAKVNRVKWLFRTQVADPKS